MAPFLHVVRALTSMRGASQTETNEDKGPRDPDSRGIEGGYGTPNQCGSEESEVALARRQHSKRRAQSSHTKNRYHSVTLFFRPVKQNIIAVYEMELAVLREDAAQFRERDASLRNQPQKTR